MNAMELELQKMQEELEATQNEVIAKFPTYKQKGYMGCNIVMIDFSPSNFKEAQTVTESLDQSNMRVNIYPAKNRVAIIF